jgi:(E)-4-hydroxy-3-methylbut-2-enyl-diphosphate synthase
MLEKYDFNDIIVSIKSSDVANTVKANRIFASETDYPIHLGVTEAGTERLGVIKSSAGIGAMLLDGIGDTLRVSLTDKVEKEVAAGKDLLKCLGLTKGVNIVSCPTCARTNINVIAIADKLHEILDNCDKDIKVAVMGCAVNGPGEAKDADIGIAGGSGDALLFKKGEVIGKIDEDKVIEVLLKEIEKM